MHPNLVDHLATFVAVAETGGFSAAARQLNRAVSSISYSMSQLEAYCGFPLLERGPRQSELTPRGRALFAEAKSVVEDARRFKSHAASLERGQETRIRIAVDVLFPSMPLHRALQRFAERHERVRLQLFTSSLNSLWDDLRTGGFDLSVALMTAIPLGMEARSFHQVVLNPVAAVTHPLAAKPQPLSVSDFQGHRQIYYIGSHSLDMERTGRLFSSDVWTSNDLEHIRLLIRHGIGWCFSTDGFFREEVATGLVRKLRCVDAQLHPSRTVGAVWPGDRRPGPLGRELIELIADEITGQA
ncbi:LysR family transcriptional regulator [Pararhizobium haloflavum]|uniref:LysR family transcriptional regulator n=1 Tax=Pararhizobium haloflavum TaxID=2037914 RepID=UPI000C192350|nr:LysR family transcriptional regulator [Pararhizobium haloflavum]